METADGCRIFALVGSVIPRVAHFYWGSAPMSFLRAMTLESFCLRNPDWKCVLHMGVNAGQPRWETSERQDVTEYQGSDHFPDVVSRYRIEIRECDAAGKSDVHAKDILAWKILANEGGVFADMDILWTRPLHALGMDGDACLVEFSGNPKPGYIPVTLMAAREGGSPIFQEALEAAIGSYDPAVYECCGAGCIGYSISGLRTLDFDVRRLPDATVFPYFHLEYGRAVRATHGIGGRTEAWDPQAVGVHWYAGNPVSQAVNNRMTRDSVDEFDSPLAKEVQRCLVLSSR